jgi:CheY-like chemotaxis protein
MPERLEVVVRVEWANVDDLRSACRRTDAGDAVFVATDRPFRAGDDLALDVSFAGMASPLLLGGVVYWCRSPAQAAPGAPVGFEFLVRPPEDRRLCELVGGAATGREAAVESTAAARGAFRVLVAGDSSLVREMLSFGVGKYHRLRVGGSAALRVVEAGDGNQAWGLLQSEVFDLVIVDYYMPEMDAVRLAQMVRADAGCGQTPLMVVGADRNDLREAAYAAGADAYVRKPLLLGQLLDALEECLRRAATRRTGGAVPRP